MNISGANLHANGSIKWDSSDEILNWLDANLKRGMQTLETGAGKSTLIFMKNQTQHHAITMAQDEIDLIKQEAGNLGFDIENTNFYCGPSQEILPHLNSVKELDLVLIDGGHGFPIPAIDWLYCAPKLKIGGTLIIDDVDLWTGKMLVDVLKGEPEWKLLEIKKSRTAIFTKIAKFEVREWCNQKTVVKKSTFGQATRKAKNALALLLQFDFQSLKQKLLHEKELRDTANKNK